MSKIGESPIKIEDGVKVEISKSEIKFIGKAGQNSLALPSTVTVKEENGELIVSRKNDEKQSKSDHGTIRSILAWMVKGVNQPYVKELEMVGMGYRAAMEGNVLVLSIGLNHPVKVTPPEGITFATREDVIISVSGIDKQKVGVWAAKIRSLKKPEPYKGKGIKYIDEVVRRKESKKTLKEA